MSENVNDSHKKPSGTPTQEIPKADTTQILIAEIKQEVKDGFFNLKTQTTANHNIVMHEIGGLKDRVSALEHDAKESERRLNTHSQRAAAPSEHDLEAKAKLAAEIVAREELAQEVKSNTEKLSTLDSKTNQQTEMLQVLVKKATKVLNNPFITIAVIVGATVGSCVAQMKMNHTEQPTHSESTSESK